MQQRAPEEARGPPRSSLVSQQLVNELGSGSSAWPTIAERLGTGRTPAAAAASLVGAAQAMAEHAGGDASMSTAGLPGSVAADGARVVPRGGISPPPACGRVGRDCEQRNDRCAPRHWPHASGCAGALASHARTEGGRRRNRRRRRSAERDDSDTGRGEARPGARVSLASGKVVFVRVPPNVAPGHLLKVVNGPPPASAAPLPVATPADMAALAAGAPRPAAAAAPAAPPRSRSSCRLLSLRRRRRRRHLRRSRRRRLRPRRPAAVGSSAGARAAPGGQYGLRAAPTLMFLRNCLPAQRMRSPHHKLLNFDTSAFTPQSQHVTPPRSVQRRAARRSGACRERWTRRNAATCPRRTGRRCRNSSRRPAAARTTRSARRCGRSRLASEVQQTRRRIPTASRTSSSPRCGIREFGHRALARRPRGRGENRAEPRAALPPDRHHRRRRVPQPGARGSRRRPARTARRRRGGGAARGGAPPRARRGGAARAWRRRRVGAARRAPSRCSLRRLRRVTRWARRSSSSTAPPRRRRRSPALRAP